MFQPLVVFPQAVKIYKIEIKITTPIMGGQIEMSFLEATKCMPEKKKTNH
jgi:hypothetical protein